jgi:hypothetical protein
MKFHHRVFLKVSALVVALSTMAGIASFAAAEGRPPYEAEVDGVTKVLTIGTEVAQGVLLSDGNCAFPGSVAITGRPAKGKNSGKITTRFTEDCKMIVSDLEWRRAANDSKSGANPRSALFPVANGNADGTEEFIGYVESSVTDKFHIEVNSVEVGIQYFDDGSTVWGDTPDSTIGTGLPCLDG